MSLTWPLFVALATLYVISVGVVLVLQRRSATATLAWLMVLVFLPILGLLLYRLIGPLRLERKKLKRGYGRRFVEEAVGALAAINAESHDSLQLAMVPIRVGESVPLPAHSVELYDNGKDAYAAIIEAIEAATHHVHLEYYIWEPDRIGTIMRDLLVRRAKAGIEVRMLVDGTGANHLSRRFLRPLRQAGVQVAFFNPVKLRQIRRRRADFRSHRKIVVCDGHVGFTGGMNITDDHTAEFNPRYFRDTHLRVAGSVVRAMQRIFLEDWYFAAGELPPMSAAYFPAPDHVPERIVQIVSSGPDSAAFAVHKTFFAAINQARHRLYITTPYFVPDEAIQAALVGAALRRVDVKLLVPHRGDSRLVDLAARSYFPELIEAGVHVFEYQPRFIHAKTMVVDDDIAIVGTANMDNRSFRLNFELAAVIYDAEVAGKLVEFFVRDLEDATPFGVRALAKVPLASRLGQAGARLFSPLL